MARVTPRTAQDAERHGDGVASVDGTGPIDDPRSVRPQGGQDGVRVRLAAASQRGEEASLRVAVLAQRRAEVDGHIVAVGLRDLGGGRGVLEQGSERTGVILEPARRITGSPLVREVLVDGFRFEVEVESERHAALRERATRGRAAGAGGGPLAVKAVFPGKVVAVSVAVGDAVEPGQQLLVVEAMKMRNELRAPRGGTIVRIGVAEGVNIEIGDVLVVIGQGGPG